MSYAIGTIIYGVPLTEKIHKAFEELGEFEVADYFEVLYSASNDYAPGYCGVKLGEFDECCDAIPFSELQTMADKVSVTVAGNSTDKAAKVTEALDKIQALPKEILKICDCIGVYMVWSSS